MIDVDDLKILLHAGQVMSPHFFPAKLTSILECEFAGPCSHPSYRSRQLCIG